MFVEIIQIEKAPYKLLQQFIECILFGCWHPMFGYIYYATSEKKWQQLLSFLQGNFLIFYTKAMRRA